MVKTRRRQRGRSRASKTRKMRRRLHKRRNRTQRGGLRIEDCPPQGYHIYLRSLNPQVRQEVTCVQLRDRINNNQYDDIFIEGPGPHNDEDEFETVQKYRANFFEPGVYISGLVSRPEALEMPPVPLAEGELPPARRLHRQFAIRDHIPADELINHIIAYFEQQIGDQPQRLNRANNNMNINN